MDSVKELENEIITRCNECLCITCEKEFCHCYQCSDEIGCIMECDKYAMWGEKNG